MNIGTLQLPEQNAQTLSPIMTGFQNAVQRNMMMQERARAGELLKYAGPQAEQALQMQKQENQYYGAKAKAAMALQNAQAQNALAEAARTQFMLKNPGFMGGDASKEIAGLIVQGVINPGDIRAGGAPQPQGPQAPANPMDELLGTAPPQQGPSPQNMPQPQAQAAPPPPPTTLAQAAAQKVQQAQQSPQANMATAAQQVLTSQGPQAPNQPNNAPSASRFDESRPFNSLAPNLNPGVQTLLNQPYAASAYARQMKAGYSFEKTPQDTKNYMIGMAAANGIDPSEAVNKFANGYSLDDLLKEKGIDRNSSSFNNTPAYAAPAAYVEKMKEKEGANASVQVLSSAVTDGMGPYARNIMGYSPKQIMDSFTGANEEQQVKFASSLMLIPDLINQRIKLVGGNPSEGQYKEILDKSQLDLNLVKAKLTPEQWAAAQKMTDQTLEKSLQAQEKTLQFGNKGKNQEQKTESSTSESKSDVKVGTVEDGYVFLGGDPADPKNWSKTK